MTEQETFDALKYRIFVDANGDKAYYNADDQLHRDEGPAFISANAKIYFVNGLIHREDGPAVEYSDSRANLWYINDKHLTEEEFNEYRARNV
jgi:hypothetical protein